MSFVNSPPLSYPFPIFNTNLPKTPVSGSDLRTLKQPLIAHRRPSRLKKTMENRVVIGDGGDECVDAAVPAFEQEAFIEKGGRSNHRTPGVHHNVLNRLSKWWVAVTLVGVVLLRHDALAMWAATGSVVNTALSLTLKQILNQDRPVSDVSSGPGMPSSHAQSISYATIFVILTIVGWLGLNRFSAILSGFTIAIGVYFSWLRVLLRYHTTSQVMVGAIVGYIFSTLWFWTWGTMVLKAFNLYLWVRLVVGGGVACFTVGFILMIVRHKEIDER